MPALRVLVIDNSIFSQEKMAKALITRLPQGSLVERSANAGDSVDKARLFRPNAVVLNFILAASYVEGSTLLGYLTRHLKVPVIAFGKTDGSKAAAISAGATAYLPRPIRTAELEDFYNDLADHLQGKVSNRETVTAGYKERISSGGTATGEIRRTGKPLFSGTSRREVPKKDTPGRIFGLNFGLTKPASFSSGRQHITQAANSKPATVHATPPPYKGGPVELIAIGSSTGGTEALSVVLHTLRPPLPGIVIVQHIPAMFSKLLSKRLDEECTLSVKEAATGDVVQRNHVYIAPGGKHMTVSKAGAGYVLDCTPGPPVHSCCPSVDVLFDTVAKQAGNKALGVILTGMGRDGASGLSHMREMGAYTIGQDEASCVVYGMPKAAFEEGAVCEQLPITQIAAAITRMSNCS